MIFWGCRRSTESIAEFREERLAQSAQARIADGRNALPDEFPIGSLFRAQFWRALQPLLRFLRAQRPDRPFSRFESELRVLQEFARQLDEFLALQCAARLVGRMIAPDAQRHSITRIGEAQLAVWLLLARELRSRRFNLDMHPCRDRIALRGPANFTQRHQLHNK